MTSDDCCSWQSEIVDDSLKSMFQADEAYAHGDTIKAVSYLQAQTLERIPLINAKARSVCKTEFKSPSKMLQADLDKISADMMAGTDYARVHDSVMIIDKKYALPAYRAFCSCRSGSHGR